MCARSSRLRTEAVSLCPRWGAGSPREPARFPHLRSFGSATATAHVVGPGARGSPGISLFRAAARVILANGGPARADFLFKILFSLKNVPDSYS